MGAVAVAVAVAVALAGHERDKYMASHVRAWRTAKAVSGLPPITFSSSGHLSLEGSA